MLGNDRKPARSRLGSSEDSRIKLLPRQANLMTTPINDNHRTGGWLSRFSCWWTADGRVGRPLNSPARTLALHAKVKSGVACVLLAVLVFIGGGCAGPRPAERQALGGDSRPVAQEKAAKSSEGDGLPINPLVQELRSQAVKGAQYFPMFQPRALAEADVTARIREWQDKGLPDANVQAPRQTGVFDLTGTSVFMLEPRGNRVVASWGIPTADGRVRSRGAIWQVSTVRVGGGQVSSIVLSGIVWTPRVSAIGNLDLATNGRVTTNPDFNFETFKNCPGVIPFANGYAVNLFGGKVDEQGVVDVNCRPQGVYHGDDQRSLCGRLIRSRFGKLDEVVFGQDGLPLPSSSAAETKPEGSPFGFGGQTPETEGGFERLFGEQPTFSATMEMRSVLTNGNSVAVPVKLWFDGNKSRIDFDVMGSRFSSDADAASAKLMKAVGMDRVVTIHRPDLKLTYSVLPAMGLYAATASDDDYEVESTNLGTETVDGHDCEKCSVCVTKKGGRRHEYLVWKALDLRRFPCKIVASQNGTNGVVVFKDVSFSKPGAGVFEVPAGFVKYTDLKAFYNAAMEEVKLRLNVYMNAGKNGPKPAAP